MNKSYIKLACKHQSKRPPSKVLDIFNLSAIYKYLYAIRENININWISI
jgi:hypothetical protein